MRVFAAFFLATGLAGLGAAAFALDSGFAIAPGPLMNTELSMDNFQPITFSARTFDIVNQDLQAEQNTGLAGHVEPSPVDILSAYAARKFQASGGIFNTRFVIQQAQFQMRSVPVNEEWPMTWFEPDKEKAELSLSANVMVTASSATDGSTSITATTVQSERISFNSTPAERREAYMKVMQKALNAIDIELAKQLPEYFGDVVLHNGPTASSDGQPAAAPIVPVTYQ